MTDVAIKVSESLKAATQHGSSPGTIIIAGPGWISHTESSIRQWTPILVQHEEPSYKKGGGIKPFKLNTLEEHACAPNNYDLWGCNLKILKLNQIPESFRYKVLSVV